MVRPRFNFFLFILAWLVLGGCAGRCVVKKDERVDFFPQPARYKPDTKSYLVRAEGRIYKPRAQEMLRGAVLGVRILNLAGAGLNTQLLQERVSSVIAENQARRAVRLEFAGGKKSVKADRTDTHGWFQQEFEIPAAALGTPDADGFARYEVPSCEGEARVGTVQLLKPGGISVVATIEDTLQATDLDNKPLAAANLLFREYQPVKGMPERFQRWKEEGAAFHYVSSIPRELYTSVARFIKEAGFPKGSIDLQPLALSGGSAMDKLERLVSMAEDPGEKSEALIRLIEQSPDRQFILVGSSGLKDPEVFGQIARRFPKQVRAIYIRETDSDADTSRYEEAFRGLPKDRWHTFEQPEGLPAGLIKPL